MGARANGSRVRRVLTKPHFVNESAEPYWNAYTQTYDFEDVEAFTLAALCNCHALAEKCQSMSFNQKTGEPLPLVPSQMMTGDRDDRKRIPNPFIDELAGINREIERLKAALGFGAVTF